MSNATYSTVQTLSVSQSCNEDGMEFTLRTPEGFIGRIYTYGYYDRCFFRGNGGTANVLRISGAQGYPECGTQRVCDEPYLKHAIESNKFLFLNAFK
jgi:hypothetical protein